MSLFRICPLLESEGVFPMDNKQIAVLDESTIKDLVYEIRGVKVMLDFDLARIYGYTTKAFNLQVKNNIERFPESFRFRLTSEEASNLSRFNFFTLNKKSERGSNIKYLPYAFTEQGIYMAMTVLKGALAVKQSITLVILFKAMRDHIAKEDPGALPRLEKKVDALEGRVDDLSFKLEGSSEKKEWLIMDGERIEASIAFRSIFEKAKRTIVLIDDYIGLKTLHLLKACKSGMQAVIISDNVATPPIEQIDLDDLLKDCGVQASIIPTYGKVHDRYIALDYGYSYESIYLCGASSKDAGNKITAIMKAECPKDFHRMFDSLLKP